MASVIQETVKKKFGGKLGSGLKSGASANKLRGKAKPVKEDKPAKKAKSAKPAKAAAVPKFQAGHIVEFTGYTNEEPEDALFSVGDRVYIASVDAVDGVLALTCLRVDDAQAYLNGDTNVRGEELVEAEVKRVRGRMPSLPKAPAEDLPVVITDVGQLADLMAEGDPVETAARLINEAQENFFYFGGVMAHIYYDKLYVESGYTGDTAWEDFCEENFGMKARKAHYYISIYMRFSALPDFDIAKLTDIGWSKASLLANYVTTDNVDELVDRAKDVTYADLGGVLKEEFTSEGKTPTGKTATRSGSVKRITFSFKLFEAGGEGVKLVLDEAKKRLGLDNDNAAFEHIVMEWGAEHLTGTAKRRAEKIAAKVAAAAEEEDDDAGVDEEE